MLQILLENGENGILADEMGLGKTVQCIAIIAEMIEVGITGPFLICAPMSTIQNWFQEFRRFCPKVDIVCFDYPIALYWKTKFEIYHKESLPVVQVNELRNLQAAERSVEIRNFAYFIESYHELVIQRCRDTETKLAFNLADFTRGTNNKAKYIHDLSRFEMKTQIASNITK